MNSTDFFPQGVQMNTDVHVLGHGPAARAHHHWRQRRRHDPVGTESLCMVRNVPLPSLDVAQLYPSLHRCTLSTQATAEILLCPPSPASSSTEASGVFLIFLEPIFSQLSSFGAFPGWCWRVRAGGHRGLFCSVYLVVRRAPEDGPTR